MASEIELNRSNTLILPSGIDPTEALRILDETGVLFDVGRSDEVVQPHFMYDGGDLTYQQFFGIGGLHRFADYRQRGLLG